MILHLQVALQIRDTEGVGKRETGIAAPEYSSFLSMFFSLTDCPVSTA